MNNKVIRFEFPCDNPEKTMQFFKTVFGWQFRPYGNEGYWVIQTGDENAPGIDGGLMKRRVPTQGVVNSIHVANIDQAVLRIEKAGGTIILAKMPIPNIGWLAYFTDPDGTIHGVFQKEETAK